MRFYPGSTRTGLISAAAALAIAGAGVALAANVHVKKSPTFIDQGLTLSASGVLAGLGNQDIQVTMTGQAAPTATCTNPAGQTQPPGQNPAAVTVSGTTVIPASAIKNGNASYTVTTNPPQTPITGAPQCPNSSWTENITDMAFLSPFTIKIEQPVGTVVLTLTCTLSPSPTKNGNVSATCS